MTTESTTIAVLAHRQAEALEALNKLAAKARRYGCPDIIVEVGEAFTTKRRVGDWDGEGREVEENWVNLIVTGEAPKVGDFEFLARVELLDGGNLVDTRPGVTDLDAKFRHTNGFCAHCNTLRRRNEVFVVRNLATGEQVQVGRDCLRDFLGIDNPMHIAQRFSFLRAVEAFRDEELRAGRAAWAQSAEGILALSAVCIRLFGWCARGQAQYDESLTPTSPYVCRVLTPAFRESKEERALIQRILSERTEADYETARETLKWVREELTADSDYAHNLKVLLAGDCINDQKRLGIVVSAVAAYQRAKEKALRLTKERTAAAASEFLGQVGQRLRDVPVTLQFQRVIGSNDFGDLVLIKFADEAGNVLTWMTSKGCGLEVGEKALLTGTVKDHELYNGTKQTKLTRCALKEVA